jgi:hypothetical protein
MAIPTQTICGDGWCGLALGWVLSIASKWTESPQCPLDLAGHRALRLWLDTWLRVARGDHVR